MNEQAPARHVICFSRALAAWCVPASSQARSTAANGDNNMSEAVLSDRRVGLISLSMWMGTAVRVYSLLSFSENAQSASAMIISECHAD